MLISCYQYNIVLISANASPRMLNNAGLGLGEGLGLGLELIRVSVQTYVRSEIKLILHVEASYF